MKPFRKQYLECKKNFNSILIDLGEYKIDLGMPTFPRKELKNIKELKTNKILICLKYKKVCMSSVCKKDRI